MIIDDDIYVEHFGVKGMKWGVRNAPENASKAQKEKVERTRSNVKKASIILGSAAAAAAVGAGAFYAKKHFNVSTKNVSKAPVTVKKFADSMAKEPVGVIHASRGRNRGFAFMKYGGLKDPLLEFTDAGLENAQPGSFKRYGKQNEKLAASFLDPLGRKDRAGRPIFHDVILPKEMAKDVHNMDDLIKVAWPGIKDIFGAYYESEHGTLGPGY